jgi:hypothetical protein
MAAAVASTSEDADGVDYDDVEARDLLVSLEDNKRLVIGGLLGQLTADGVDLIREETLPHAARRAAEHAVASPSSPAWARAQRQRRPQQQQQQRLRGQQRGSAAAAAGDDEGSAPVGQSTVDEARMVVLLSQRTCERMRAPKKKDDFRWSKTKK